MLSMQNARRDVVLCAAGAFAAFGLDKPVALIGAATAQGSAEPGFRSQRLGDIEVITLNDGVIRFPLREGWIRNASTEQTRAALRAADLEDTRIDLPFTATALRLRDRIALVDTGTGGFPIYGPTLGMAARSMAAAGIERSMVDTVLISHLHGDHIYGLMDRDTLAPLYPNAEIIVPAAELRWWAAPGSEAQASGPFRAGLAERIAATLARWPNVRRIDGETEILPGVRVLPAAGHTPGQVIHQVSAGREQLLITADVSLLPALFLRNPDWQVGLDLDGAMAAATRRRIFERAIAEGALVTGTHWPMPNLGRIVRDGHGYAFTPVT